MVNEFLRARSPIGSVGVSGVVDSGELSAYSLGTLSGFEGDSVSDWTLRVGGQSGVQDVTIARNPAGESELVAGTPGQTTDFLLSGAPGTPGQSRTDALVVYKDITLTSEVNDGIDTVDYLVVEGTPASTGSQEPPSMSTIRSVVPNGAQAFIGIVGYVTVSYGQSSVSLGNYRVNVAQLPNRFLVDHEDRIETLEDTIAFRIERQANQSISSGGAILQFDTIVHDTGGNCSTSSHRFTAPYNGIYQFNYQGTFAATSAQLVAVQLRVNGSTVSGESQRVQLNIGTNSTTLVGGCSLSLNAGDYVQINIVPGTSRGCSGSLSGFLVARL